MSVEILMSDSDVLNILTEESEVFKCKYCDNSFMKAKALKKHMKKSHFRVETLDNDDSPKKTKDKFECNYCEKMFKKDRNLSMHIKEDHDDEDLDDESVKFDIKIDKLKKGENECPECGIDYHIQSELERHMKLRHVEQKTVDNNLESNLEELLVQDGDESTFYDGSDPMSLDEVVENDFGPSGERETTKNQPRVGGVEIEAENVDIESDIVVGGGEAEVKLNVEAAVKPNIETEFELDNEASLVVFDNEASSVELHVLPEVEPDGDPEVELDGEAVSMENINFDFNQSDTNESSESMTEKQYLAEHLEDVEAQTESVEVELPMDNVLVDNSMNFEVNGDSIVMDDAAFELLESAMQMTMSTPDDSDEEEDVPLSRRKRKNKSTRVPNKRGRPSKRSKQSEEIILDGEAVVENLDEVDDTDDIVVLDEKIVARNDDSESSEESEDDYPDFSPSGSFSKKNLATRKSVRSSKRSKLHTDEEANQITPMEKEKVLGRTRTKISVVPANSSPILETIPKSTKIVFKSSSATTNIKTRNLNDASTPKKLLCSLCKTVFLTREQFNDHMLTDHKNSASAKVLPHQNKKIQSKTFDLQKCGKCDKAFVRKTMLDDHIKAVHNHKCSKCRQKFDSEKYLRSHMQTHLVKCDKCSFAGESKQKVLDHKKAEHNFKCSKCRQAFEMKDILDSHYKANHVFKCGKCNVNFESKSLKEEHDKKQHYFPCSYCDKVFDMKQRLMTHDKTSHQSCEVCEDEFSWPEPGHTCYYTKNKIRPTIN